MLFLSRCRALVRIGCRDFRPRALEILGLPTLPSKEKGRGNLLHVYKRERNLFSHQMLASACLHVSVAIFSSVYILHSSLTMSFKVVGSALTRTLWTRGQRTPPAARSPKVNRLSTTCRVSGKQQGCDKTKSCSSDSDRPSGEGPSPSSEPPHRFTTADKKRPKEPVGAPGVNGVRRSYTSAAPVSQSTYLWARYNDTKRLVHGKQRVPTICPKVIPNTQRRLPSTSPRLSQPDMLLLFSILFYSRHTGQMTQQCLLFLFAKCISG